MAAHQAKSILIRHRDNDKDPNNHQQPSKIQRPETPGDDETVQPTRIIDLNDDCLMKIFGRLDLESLFSVAVANEWLRPAAAEVYKRKFGTMKVMITKCDDYQQNARSNASNPIDLEYPALRDCYSYAKVIGLKTCLQFLRCFGSSIDKLFIDFDNSKSKRYQYVFQQTNNYCTESLIEFSILDMPNIAIEQKFQSVFSNVTSVQFLSCSLGQQWPSIVECFPNVQNLYMHNVYCKANKVIQKPIQNLQNIRIVGWKEKSSHKIIKNLLQMTRQLKSLEITTYGECGVRMDKLFDWIKYNRLLSRLIMRTYSATIPINSNEVKKLVANHPALIVLVLPDYRFAVDDAITVVRESNSLMNFHFPMQRSDYTNLVNQLADVWKSRKSDTINSNYVLVDLNRWGFFCSS